MKFVFLNIGHFLDHYFVLIFATVAALTLANEWQIPYADLIPIATPGFLAFGLFSLPAGWLADRWSRDGMMAIFFIGIGLGSIACGFATTPLELTGALLLMGIFASIYHPVGIPLVLHGRDKAGIPVAVNGIFGNLGVGAAALITGLFIDSYGWRTAFYLPGVLSIVIGISYYLLFGAESTRATINATLARSTHGHPNGQDKAPTERGRFDLGDLSLVIMLIIVITSMMGGFIYQSATFALPKVFDERLADLAGSATAIGWFVFAILAVAALAQVVVGFLLDRFSARSVLIGVTLLQAAAFATVLATNNWTLVAMSTLAMVSIFAQIPINEIVLGRLVPPENRGTAFAARYLVVFLTMGASLPILSWLHKIGGFDLAFLAMAACGLTSAFVASRLPALRPTSPVIPAGDPATARP